MTEHRTVTPEHTLHPPYRGRFAPSPTGPLHFGSLIAAAGSYLQARSQTGRWLVRIEDIDPPREVPGAADDILRTLEIYGFEWDEPVTYQSQRSELYEDALAKLRRQKRLYACRCSRKSIAEHTGHHSGPLIYPGICRNKGLRENTPHSLRIITEGAYVEFEDRIQGAVSQNLEQDVGDFILRRRDRLFAYQLAVAVDDLEQAITEVVRGCDLLDCTAQQIYLLQQLGHHLPAYAHLPVAANEEGHKLSKQTYAAALPADRPVILLCRALAFLGHSPPEELYEASIEDFWRWAIAHWRLAQVPKRIAIQAPHSV